jgi:hypothetical protein
MATFAELVTASANAGLVEKIKIATLIAADGITTESTNVAHHSARARWAVRVFDQPDVEAAKMVWPVVVKNRAFTLAQITGASEEAVQTAVNSCVNIRAAGV